MSLAPRLSLELTPHQVALLLKDAPHPLELFFFELGCAVTSCPSCGDHSPTAELCARCEEKGEAAKYDGDSEPLGADWGRGIR